MVAVPRLSKFQLVAALVYAAIFPLTNLAGGGAMLVGITLTMPFLPLAWVGGMAFVHVLGGESAYLCGASLTVLVEVLLLMVAWSALQKRRNASAGT